MISTAQKLLGKALEALGDGELSDAIEAYLSNRYVSGGRIVLGVRGISTDCDPKTTEGFTVVTTPESFEHDGKTHNYTHDDVTYPELGSCRLYDSWSDGIIVPICGRLWRVSYFESPSQGVYDDFPTANGKQLVFEAVEEGTEETEFEAWDPVEHARGMLQKDLDSATREFQVMEDAVARFHAGTQPFDSKEAYYAAMDASYEAREAQRKAGEELTYDQTPLYVTQKTVDEFEGRVDTEYGDTRESLTAAVAKAQQELEKCEVRYRHPKFLCMFGQPNWVQGESYPADKGRPGMALATIDTQWGDSGNENLMLAVDDEGFPVAAWFEASCS